MTILRAEDFEAFLKNKSAKVNGLLLHGSDEEAVGALARQAIHSIAGRGNVPSATLHIDSSALKENPSRMVDEFQSLSLLGDRQIISVLGVDDNFFKFALPVFKATAIANFVVLTAGSLGKSSKLRTACEEAPLFASLAIYEEDRSALASRIRRKIGGQGFTWASDAEDAFFARVGFDRSAVNQEISKLMLYCLGLSAITEADVNAICGDTASFGTDELIDAVMQGDLAKTDRMTSSFDGDSRTILILLLNHVARLQNLRAEMDNGSSADQVLRSAKPPIFFKRQTAFKGQIRKFDLDGLIALQEQISSAILQTRKLPDISAAITSRTLLSVARNAASKSN